MDLATGIIVCNCCGGPDAEADGDTGGEGKARAAKAREGAQRTRSAAGMQAEGLTGFVCF